MPLPPPLGSQLSTGVAVVLYNLRELSIAILLSLETVLGLVQTAEPVRLFFYLTCLIFRDFVPLAFIDVSSSS